MRFTSDRQRRAVFAGLNRFSDKPKGGLKSPFGYKIEPGHGAFMEVEETDIYVDPKLLEKVDTKGMKFLKLSRRPKALGSVWIGGEYVHGPRIRQPEEFEFVKNVEPSRKFFHFKGAEKLPSKLPAGSKLVVGKLKGSGEWAVQSTLVPKGSKLGKALMSKA
jgi:hypothetical protein